ncbi:MAG: FGGY-family carbohydrate kinase [Atopobiaceae bacterium]|jgi:sugar (pentulose or hexulose) kinase|nr:FGGY-family carbohydrate kinase [Atopobiaceae bacterium]MCI2173992.1 FGGY-family carbohydrate kinase [Atopobiaceae bacterium]MCI2207918.1 FGGY-family carbohydrate kinase [Atopobiaceae bacterium]
MAEDTAARIEAGACSLGIEYGSTRIKAVLVDESNEPVAIGTFDWENRLEGGYWTYGEDEIFQGLAACYASLKADVASRYGVTLTKLASMGVSAMMHGYLPFDGDGRLLVPFRTWRNTTTSKAAAALTDLFGFHIPERWSIAHLYEAILDDEPHVSRVRSFTTLAGFAHARLTGEHVLSVGDASGMFPIDSAIKGYDAAMIAEFDALPRVAALGMHVEDLLPRVAVAGEVAGYLTAEGAALLDAAGDLQPGCPLCPPEGDAGTGMIATNSVAQRTGNVSAGTSVFSMVVLDHPLKDATVSEIDLVTTPVGDAVAMVHCNNCTSDINDWVELLDGYNHLMGFECDKGELFGKLFESALAADKDAGGIMSSPFISGEPIMGVNVGHPLLLRREHADFSIANLMRMNIMAAFGTLKVGNDILRKEDVRIDKLYGHGGIFKTPRVAQSILAAAMDAPVTVLATAGEGGAWGQAVAASYMIHKSDGQTLADYLTNEVFVGMEGETIAPDPADVAGYEAFIKLFRQVNEVERAAEKAVAED